MYFDDLEMFYLKNLLMQKQLSESKEIMILTALYLDGQKLSGDLS